jgi:hypothetical protein
VAAAGAEQLEEDTHLIKVQGARAGWYRLISTAHTAAGGAA